MKNWYVYGMVFVLTTQTMYAHDSFDEIAQAVQVLHKKYVQHTWSPTYYAVCDALQQGDAVDSQQVQQVLEECKALDIQQSDADLKHTIAQLIMYQRSLAEMEDAIPPVTKAGRAVFNSLVVTNTLEVDGSLLVEGNSRIIGNQSVGGNLVVTGSVSTAGGQTMSGDQTLNGNLTVNGNETLNGSLTVTGTTKLSSLGAGAVITNSSSVVSSTAGVAGQVLTSNGPGSPPTFQFGGGMSGVTQITGDSGTPLTGAITIAGGSNLTTSSGGSTLTVDLDNSPSVSGSLSAGTSVSAGTTVTAGTGLTVSSGGITSTGTTTLNSLGAGVVNTNSSGVVASTATTNHAVQIGNAASTLTSLAVGTNGQVLLGATGANPAFATLTSTGGTITYTPGANSLNIDGTAASTSQSGVVQLATNAETIAGVVTTKAITPDDLKAKLGTQTAHGVLVAEGTASALTALSVGTNGQVLLGATGADPAFATLTSTGGTITFTTGANSLNLETSGATANSFVTGSGTATPVAGVLNVPNGSNINTTGAGNTLTINLVNSPSVSGSLSAGTTVTAGTGITATTGNIAASSGNVTASGLVSAGTSMSAGTTITAGTGLTVTSGGAAITGSSTINGGTVGIGTDATDNTLSIGTAASAGRTINIGNTTGTSGIVERVGTGNYSLDGAAGSTYTVGASTTTGTITIGGTAETGTMTLGSSSGTNTQIIAGGTGATTLQIANAQNGGSVSIGTGMTTGTVSIGGTGAQTGTVSLAPGTGAQTVNIATGGTGAKTLHIGDGAAANVITLGTTNGAASLTERVGTGNFSLDGVAGSTYAVGASTTTGTITIGGTAQTGTMTFGSSSGTNIVNVGTGAGATTVNIATGATNAKTIHIGDGAVANTVTIANSAQAHSVNIGSSTTTGTIQSGILGMPNTNSGGTQGVLTIGGTRFLHQGLGATLGVFVGNAAGKTSSTGSASVGVGTSSLTNITIGSNNSGLGANTLVTLTDGTGNTAVGSTALFTSNGSSNTALGTAALMSLGNGSNNSVVGFSAGSSFTGTESSNIIIGNAGTLGDNNITRIGTEGTGAGQQNKCFVAGIVNATVTGSAVLVSATGQLGLVVSARRYKDEIQDMADASSALMQLRPVTFSYKTDATRTKQFGLIAEEVAELIPELVNYDLDGNIMSVKYHELPAMLLNEYQKLAARVAMLEAQLAQCQQSQHHAS